MRATTAVLLATLLSLASGADAAAQVTFDPPDEDARADGLALHELLVEVAARNPGLRAANAAADAAGSRVAGASTLPDPVLQVGVMNFGLPDFETDMPNSMAPSVELMQTVPFPGKLDLRGRVAGRTHAMAQAGAAEAWWRVRGATADIFYRLYELDRRIEVTARTLDLLEDFQGIARAMYASGTGRQADVLRADVEVARMDGEIRRLRAQRAADVARLNGLLDRPAGTPVGSPELPTLPLDVPPADTLRAWAGGSRPSLERARLDVRRAEAGTELAHREIWPDLSLGLTYGQRSGDTGTRRMGSVMVGFSLPIHAGVRQLAARDEAEAERRVAEAGLATAQAEVDARIGEELAELERARSLIALYRSEMLPQARSMVQSALSSYRVGAVDFSTLVEAQLAVNRFEEELHELVADYGAGLARLESVVARPIPATGQVLVATLEER